MENFLKTGGGQNTHTRPAKFTPFHKRLALIYFALPNSGFFKAPTVDLLIERHAGGHEKTKYAYWNSLKAWCLLIPVGLKQYERGLCPDWLREAYELAREGDRSE